MTNPRKINFVKDWPLIQTMQRKHDTVDPLIPFLSLVGGD